MSTTKTDAPVTTEALGEMLADVDTQVRALVRERPLMAVLGAVAAGFLIGRLLRSRA